MNDDWIYIDYYRDPPPPPHGYKTQVKRDSFLGLVIAYRYVEIREERK